MGHGDRETEDLVLPFCQPSNRAYEGLEDPSTFVDTMFGSIYDIKHRALMGF